MLFKLFFGSGVNELLNLLNGEFSRLGLCLYFRDRLSNYDWL